MSKIYVDEIAGIASPSTVAIPGHVIQVVSSYAVAQTGTSSTSFVDAGISASITPSSTNSRIMVLVTGSVQTGGGGGESGFVITDGSNTELTNTYKLRDIDGQMWSVLAINFMHSPNSTASITYKLRMKTSTGTTYFGSGGDKETLTLMEIAG